MRRDSAAEGQPVKHESHARVTAADLALSASLRPIEWRVWVALKYWANPRGIAWPSVGSISKILGVAPSGVRRGLKGLREAGLLHREGKYLHLHPPETREPPPETQEPPLPKPGSPPSRNPGAPPSRNPGAKQTIEQPKEQTNEQPSEKQPEQSLIPQGVVNPPKRTKAKKTKPKEDPQVQELFEFWKATLGKTKRCELDAKRRRDLKQALADLGMETAKQAIVGISRSDWWMGRGEPERYQSGKPKALNEPRHIFATAERLEDFLELGAESAPEAVSGVQMSDVIHEWGQLHTKGLNAFSAAEPQDGIRTVGGIEALVYEDPIVDTKSQILGSALLVATRMSGPIAEYLCNAEIKSAKDGLQREIDGVKERERRRNARRDRSPGQLTPSSAEAS